MKKFLLIFIISAIVINGGFAQQRAKVLTEKSRVSVLVKYVPPYDEMLPTREIIQGTGVNKNNTMPPKDGAMIGDETEIIETLYDLQSNSTLGNRIHAWPDGTISAVCTRGIDQPAGFVFPDRGTGYNYFDGSSWNPKPTSRVETVRTGWPSIASLGLNGEIIVSHRFGVKLVILTRPAKGTGNWAETYYSGPGGNVNPSWPRMVTSGESNEFVQLIYNTNGVFEGQTTALLYSRSSDGGQTWDIQDQLLEGVGSDYYIAIGADEYVMAAKGNVVAVLVVDLWKDLFLMKSTNNGSTWQKKMIWEHPYPFFDIQTTLTSDTLYTADKSASLAIDSNGMCHVVWGIGRVSRLASSPPEPGFFDYWPYTDGIGYWNEGMGQIPEAPNPHHTMSADYLESLGMLCGWTQDVNNSGFLFDYEGTGNPQFNTYRSIGISTMPTLAINSDGIMAVAFSSVTETYVTPDGLQNYKHIWARASADNGVTWGDFYDLQAGNIFHIYDECIYPVLTQSSPIGGFNLIYMADNQPGLYVDEDHDPTTNRIIHNKLPYSDLNIVITFLHPTNLTATVNPPNTVVLNWNSPADKTFVGKALLGFNIYRDGDKVNGFVVPNTTFTNLNVPVGLHTYYVKAIYSSGISAPSNTQNVLIKSFIPEHFLPVWSSPYNPMTFYILKAAVDEIDLESGAEIGIFDIDPNNSEEICVGVGVIVDPLTGGNYLEVIASMDDGSVVGQANGFTPGHDIIYKLWSETTGETSTVQANYPYPGYDEVFASQGNAFVSLSGTIQALLTVTTTSNPPEGGTTSGYGNYQPGTLVTVSATANDCWSFVSWTENGSIVSTNPEFTFTIEDNRNLTANFDNLQYQVFTSSNPAGGGTTSGDGTYDCGEEVTVSATSFSGYTFVNWTENGTEVSNQASFTFLLESNRNLVANFQVEIIYFEPVWTSPYNPMTFYVVEALLDNVDLQPLSQIGVFDTDPNNGDEICVGTMILNSVISPGNYLEIITSMNDGTLPGHANGFTPGHPFIFKYMSNTGQLVEDVQFTFPYSGYNEVFTSQGAAIIELSGTGTIPEQQTISLNIGWTGISSYLIPQNSSIQNVLAGIEDELIIIQNLDEFYQPGNPTSSLQNWDYQSGYFIKVTDETTLTFFGTIPGNKSISLSTGWNLIPVLSDCEVSINALFAGQIDKLVFMKNAIGFDVYWPSKTISMLTQLIPGHSYLVKVTENIQVTFPECE